MIITPERVVGVIKRWFVIMAHQYDWHYAPVFGPISGHSDGKLHYQRWCQWCGLREDYPYDPRIQLEGPLTALREKSEKELLRDAQKDALDG